MIQLDGLIESYKREVAPPGQFDEVFPGVTEDDVLGALADGFAEAQLEGFFSNYTLDPDAFTVDPLLTSAGGALVVIYAGMRTVRNILRSNVSTRYKAGSVEYETSQSASTMVELLKDMRQRRQELINLGRRGGSATYVLDGYFSRMTVAGSFAPAEIPMVPVGI